MPWGGRLGYSCSNSCQGLASGLATSLGMTWTENDTTLKYKSRVNCPKRRQIIKESIAALKVNRDPGQHLSISVSQTVCSQG